MLESTIVLDLFPDEGLLGRTKIFTNQKQVDASNVIDVVGKAMAFHLKNQSEIDYLYDYYRGKQDIRLKDKVVRPEINNKVIVNRANEIVSFKTAYILQKPIRYVSNGGNDDTSAQVAKLNEFMASEDKDSKDKKLIDWMHICGLGVRMVLPDQENSEDSSPVSIYTLDPRMAFVIYNSGIGERPVAAVIIQKDEQGNRILCVYTKSEYFEISGNKISKQSVNNLSRIPVIEYPNNECRMGAFEVVISLLNAINTLESNRVDSIQDFVNAFDVFQNCEIGDEYSKLSTGGRAIEIKTGTPGMEAKVYRVTSELNQTSAQTIVDDMYQSVLTICGMPNRNGGSSTSDTGQASILRDGWEAAESKASDTEKTYLESEREFTKLVLHICNNTSQLNLKLSEVNIEFTRKNLTNIQSKVQILCELLNNGYVHPRDAYIVSSVFADSEAAYINGMKWHEENQQKMQESLMGGFDYGGTEESVPPSGQSDSNSQQTSDTEV